MLRLRQVVNKTQIGLQCSTVIAIGRRRPRQEPITTLRCAVWHAPAGTPPRTTQIVNSFTGRTTQNITQSSLASPDTMAAGRRKVTSTDKCRKATQPNRARPYAC